MFKQFDYFQERQFEIRKQSLARSANTCSQALKTVRIPIMHVLTQTLSHFCP